MKILNFTMYHNNLGGLIDCSSKRKTCVEFINTKKENLNNLILRKDLKIVLEKELQDRNINIDYPFKGGGLTLIHKGDLRDIKRLGDFSTNEYRKGVSLKQLRKNYFINLLNLVGKFKRMNSIRLADFLANRFHDYLVGCRHDYNFLPYLAYLDDYEFKRFEKRELNYKKLLDEVEIYHKTGKKGRILRERDRLQL